MVLVNTLGNFLSQIFNGKIVLSNMFFIFCQCKWCLSTMSENVVFQVKNKSEGCSCFSNASNLYYMFVIKIPSEKYNELFSHISDFIILR